MQTMREGARKTLNYLSPIPESAVIIALTVCTLKLTDKLGVCDNLSTEMKQGLGMTWFTASIIMFVRNLRRRASEDY